LIRRYVVAVGLAAAVVVLDLLTKRWAETELQDGPIVLVSDFLVLSFTENSGAAFGLFRGGGAIFGVAALVVSIGLLYSLRIDRPTTEVIAFALIIGGAAGNLANRVSRGEGVLDGKVIDWIDLWWIPTFNVADASITIAVALLLLHSWLARSP
jgi:signal peptidase II